MIKKGLHHRWKLHYVVLLGVEKCFHHTSVFMLTVIKTSTCILAIARLRPNQTKPAITAELMPHSFLYVSWSNFRFPSSIRIYPAFKNCCEPLVFRPILSLASKKCSLFRILSHRFFSKAVRWNREWEALGQGHLICSCVWIKISYCSCDYSIHWSYLVVIPLEYAMFSLIPKPQVLVLRGILIW